MTARVLVVDDDPAIRRAFSMALARDGFDVASAEDAGPAIERAAAVRPDIVVVDFNMPTCGLEVVHSVRASRGAAVFIVVLTGDDDPVIRERAISTGADCVMVKPVPTQELRARLSAAVRTLREGRDAS